MRYAHLVPLPWRDPAHVLAAVEHQAYAVGLLSDGRGRWSYVASEPAALFHDRRTLEAGLARWQTSDAEVPDGWPPFRGGAIGLAAYEWGATLEPSAPQARTQWPDLTGGFYDALLAFDHERRQAWAIGRGDTPADAQARAQDISGRRVGCFAAHQTAHQTPARSPLVEHKPSAQYQAAVADVIDSVIAGEIFQANIARTWSGALPPGATPFDICKTLLRRSPAPFAAYLRLPGLALVSNSPERFLQITASGEVRTQPIKGTSPRGATPAEDAAHAAALLASEKDRAENLMIVDLMRNDIARSCTPGSVAVPALCALETFANVHHLVSTVTGQLAQGATALDAFARCFPPGSITGAPKLQAMAVIARHEPPRGPYCGSLFWAGCDGALDSSVLIRTIAFTEGPDGAWRFDTRAGAAITADSIPADEDAETRAKIAAIRAALAEA
jgi:para-aminobenzoate synthetase component 1